VPELWRRWGGGGRGGTESGEARYRRDIRIHPYADLTRRRAAPRPRARAHVRPCVCVCVSIRRVRGGGGGCLPLLEAPAA
jgi:hypothetical protein